MTDDSTNPRARSASGGRYTPRLDTLGQLQVQVLSAPTPVTVREVSLGGFSLESTVPFACGTCHRFRFTLEGGPAITALADCVYSNRLSPSQPLPTYQAGFEFVPVSDEASASIAGLVYRIAELWDWEP
jgi:hypothetical protein